MKKDWNLITDFSISILQNANITSVPLLPPPGIPSNESESRPAESNASSFQNANLSKMVAPPPPAPLHQQHQSTFAGAAASLTNFQPDVHPPPGMLRFPPPPPPLDMHPPHPGMFVGHLIPRPPYGPPPGPPPMMRPPLPPGPPPSSFQDGQAMIRPYVPNKPSFVKSAAPTVVRRPLAQHTPELTSMVSYMNSQHLFDISHMNPKHRINRFLWRCCWSAGPCVGSSQKRISNCDETKAKDFDSLELEFYTKSYGFCCNGEGRASQDICSFKATEHWWFVHSFLRGHESSWRTWWINFRVVVFKQSLFWCSCIRDIIGEVMIGSFEQNSLTVLFSLPISKGKK